MGKEERLLTKILRTGDMKTALLSKVKEEAFQDGTCALIFRHIRDHFEAPATKGQVPTIEEIQRRYPRFEPEDVQAEVATLSRELLNDVLSREMSSVLETAEDIIVTRPDKALDMLVGKLRTIQARWSVSDYSTIADVADELVRRYDLMRSGNYHGIPYPWPGFNEASGGVRNGELVVLYATQKSMKSWVLWNFAYQTFLTARRVLLVSTEMPMQEAATRMMSLIGEVSYRDLDQGKLDEREFGAIIELSRSLFEDDDLQKPFISFLTKDQNQISGVDSIRAAIEASRPQAVFIDSAYNLSHSDKNPFDWKTQSKLISALHDLAVESDLPIIITTQANSEKKLSFSKAYAQFADVVISIEKVDTLHRTEESSLLMPTLFLRAEDIRRFRYGGSVVEIDPGRYFRETESFISRDEFDAFLTSEQERSKTTGGVINLMGRVNPRSETQPSWDIEPE